MLIKVLNANVKMLIKVLNANAPWSYIKSAK